MAGAEREDTTAAVPAGSPLRCHARVAVELRSPEGEPRPLDAATTSNVSPGGLYVRGTPRHGQAASFAQGERLRVAFTLPSQADAIETDAEVMWVNHNERDAAGGPALGLGLRFVALTGEITAAIEDFVDNFRFQILACDDDPDVLDMLTDTLSPMYRMQTCSSGREALNTLGEDDIKVLVLDYSMPDMTGLDVIEEIGRQFPHQLLVTVVYSAYVGQDLVDKINRLGGTFRFLRKGTSVAEMRTIISDAVEYYGLVAENERLSDELLRANERLLRENVELRQRLAGTESTAQIIGRSKPMLDVIEQLKQVSSYGTTVHIRGETGTGKELFARALHKASNREGPFLAFSCAGVPQALLESTLFGHTKGAFTGASQDRLGLFEQANGGTVFLDEVGELTSAMQTSLLRVLEEGEVIPLGTVKPRQVNVRVVSATNRSLEDEVRAGRFRQDLYYRLVVFELQLPPLRDRREDIPLLAEQFLQEVAETHGGAARGFTPACMKALESWSWPGNVRELRNEVERAVIRSGPDNIVDLPHLSPGLLHQAGSSETPAMHAEETLPEILRRVESELIKSALARTNGVASRAAALLGIDPSTLRKKIQRLNLS